MRSVVLIIIFFFNVTAYSQLDADVEIWNVRDLVFPVVIPGFSSTVLTTNSDAGRLSITITRNRTTVSVTFSLPTHLSSGNNSLPVTFTATKSNNSNDGNLGTSFDPYAGTTIYRETGSTKDWYIRLGGVINTPITQAGGVYKGSIIITFMNLGN
ncbi:MAG: hypothetical protein WC644_11170 [Ignavibacteria bacterium]